MSFSMPLRSIRFFFFLWTTVVIAALAGAQEGMNVKIFYLSQGGGTDNGETFLSGECIPVLKGDYAPQQGFVAYPAVSGTASQPAICVQYESEHCKGKVLDQKFELQQGDKPLPFQQNTAKSVVCIPKAPM
ncbi:hypothetical protein BCR42DRAFT_427151 [Absidia repens]|uniref:Uncharacterized protein n=1 Tax=Absidia repens TaxID=90262 RepID=A0A1X2I019_9FUNG|nr:hypothetical protein BCR42DRAFT_427151 [Absidia repens]